MAATMNTAADYRDATLDHPAAQPPSQSRRDGPVNRKITDQEWRSASNGHATNTYEPQVHDPDTTIGRTISYRGVGPGADPKLHRSFSQRAKGRPFAEEAFADDNVDDYTASKPQQTNGRSASARYKQNLPEADVTRAERRPSQNTGVQNASPQMSSNSTMQGRSRGTIGGPPKQGSEPLTPVRSASQRDAGNQTEEDRRNWAFDRSPLQKLEVKLTDISKEEKRARVQEAEMRYRDSQASQGSQRPSRQAQQPTRAVSEPVRAQVLQENINPEINVADNGFNRSQQPARTSRNRMDNLPVSRQGFKVDIPPRQHGVANQRNTISKPKQNTGVQRSQEVEPDMLRQPGPSQSAPRVVVGASMNNTPRSAVPRNVSLRQSQPQASMRRQERPLSERERNASHQATLQQLTGQAAQLAAQRGGAPTMRKPQPPRNQYPDVSRATTDRQASMPGPVDMGTPSGAPQQGLPTPKAYSQINTQSGQSQSLQPMFGLGVQNPPARIPNSQSVDNSESNKTRQRKSSVSFKEPFDKRRPVDEWRTAETATLTADDFSTDLPKANGGYKAWWEQDQSKTASKARASDAYETPAATIDDRTASFNPPLNLKCGPLLRYTGMKRNEINTGSSTVTKEFWRGTVMIVTQDSQCSYEAVPSLRLFSQPRKLLPPPPSRVTEDQLAPEYIDPIAGLTKLSRSGRALYVRPVDHLEEGKDLSRIEDDTGIYESSPSPLDGNSSKSATTAATNNRTLDSDGERLGRYKEVKGVRIYADPDRDVTFWRFNIEVELGPEQQHIAYRINKGASVGFWVPAQGKTMNIMFQSCNGFSISVDSNTFSGPDPLWRDVLNNHQTRPFHVMIGGGDQVYNDRAMVETELFAEWTKLRNPHQKHQAQFTPEMRAELETFYLERYCMWFSQGLFAMANASIPMVNVWDDHDIIDGFGSYPDHFMRAPVFSGLGEVAHKYYLLFQHQTIDAMTEKDEPSWLLGTKPGPYIQHLSRNVYLELGQSVAFLGVDARTERSRDDVLSIDTLEKILERCRREMVEGRTKHLIVLLGVPIAYPRLVWLENVLTSKAVDPIKALHRAGFLNTKLLNRFDGGVEILDDLDDHWTASHHKDERNIMIQDLQDLAAEKSARITILSGDVHLAAIGQFYSNPKLKVPKDRDHRYMPNIISSAIVNTPPPDMLADVLNKRNKVHHLDKYTDENMIPMFTHDVDDKKRNNTRLLPRRNWCSIREYLPGETPPPTPPSSPSLDEDGASHDSDLEGQYQDGQIQNPKRRSSFSKSSFNPRQLMRRFSSKGPPPNSYRSSSDRNQFQQRAASFDGVSQGQAGYEDSPQLRASSADQIHNVPALRPTYHRRPTNLSEKAARKGIVPAIDAEGNEFDYNDHVNLEGGLDIVLNCEVNQRDPAGITTPYRLLVPALWYDGSSDREKLSTSVQPNKRGTILQKFGLNPRRDNRPADDQDTEVHEDDVSQTESYTDSEGETPEPKKPRFSFLGSFRKKQPDHRSLQEIGDSERPSQAEKEVATQQNSYPPTNTNPAPLHELYVPPTVNSNGRQAQPLTQRDQNTYQLPANDPSEYQVTQVAQRSHNNYQPPTHGFDDQSTNRGTRLSQNSYETTQQPIPQPLPDETSQRPSQRISRPLSYVIGGGSGPQLSRSAYSSTQVDGRPPYDPDAAYVSGKDQRLVTDPQRPSTSGQLSQTRGSHDGEYVQPQQRQLRGNGIIGRIVPPTSYRGEVGVQYDDYSEPPPSPGGGGYSGIEAYREKPKRRWSLREKARSIFDRRKNNDEEWYSDEDEAQYWEGERNDEQWTRSNYMKAQNSGPASRY